MDATDQRAIVRDVLHDLDIDERQIAPGATLAEISKAKNNLWTPDEYEERHPSFIGERYAQIYREYERRLGESNGLDFDDLIMRTIQLARTTTKPPATTIKTSSATCWSMSIRTSTSRSTGSSRSLPASTRTSRSSATTISRSIRGAAATTA